MADLHTKFGKNVFEVKTFDYEEMSILPLTLYRENCPRCKACVLRQQRLDEEKRIASEKRAQEERLLEERRAEAKRLAEAERENEENQLPQLDATLQAIIR